MGEINQIGKELVAFHFCLRWVHQVISKKLSLTLTWKSESLVVKSSMDTI